MTEMATIIVFVQGLGVGIAIGMVMAWLQSSTWHERG